MPGPGVGREFEEHFAEDCEYDIREAAIWGARAHDTGYVTPVYCPFCGQRVVEDEDG